MENKRQISIEYVLKKIEKLVTAVYMLTDFISDKEPIKYKVRDLGLVILSDTHSLGNLLFPEKKSALKKLCENIENMVSLFEVAASLKLVSAMNMQVLKEEFFSVKSALQNHVFMSDTDTSFTPNFFALPEPENTKGNGVEKKSNAFSKGHTDYYKGHSIHEKENKKDKMQSISSGILEVSKHTDKKYKRREDILRIVKDSNEATIKDIFTKLRGVGEKTVQRELAGLILDGLIKKTGERRWSRYSLR